VNWATYELQIDAGSTRHDVDCSKIGVLEALAACFLERNGLGDAEGIGLEAQYVKVEYQNL